VAQTLDRSKITADLLAKKNLDPVQLATHFVSEAKELLASLPDERAELFKRVIAEASQSIIDIAHSLPNFNERTLGELLQRTQVMAESVHQVFEELERLRARTPPDPLTDSTRFENDYRRAVARNLDRMELFGVENLQQSSRTHQLSSPT
jgi:hypothetical protein